MKRAIIDTNVFVAALLFEGECSRLVPLWQGRRFVYLLSRPILDEYLRVLSYPKFELTDKEIKVLISEDLLPYVEVVQVKDVKVPRLKDRDDEKFIQAALSGNADYLVTGDSAVLELKRVKKVKIVSPIDFLRSLTGG